LNEEEEVYDEVVEEYLTRPKRLRLWDETKHHLIVPRHFLSKAQMKDFPCEFRQREKVEFEKAQITDLIRLRDRSQSLARDALIRHKAGILNLSCGKGKTVVALKAAATFKLPTLIVVNTSALLEQWKDEIRKHLRVSDIGTVQGTVADWRHPITVATVQTLSFKRDQWPKEFRRYFGVVIYDEAHHMSAPIFVRSADLFYGHRLSLTATATRTDGLEAIYQAHLGRVIYQDLSQELIPHTIFHVLKWELPICDKRYVTDSNGEVHPAKVRVYLGRLNWRNKIIYQFLSQDLSEGRTILVLSHGLKHTKTMQEYFSASGSGLITGAVAQADRIMALRNTNPVFGTFQLAREGLNKPELDTLYITTPFSAANDLQQAWGRIQREFPGKKPPLVRVFEDTAFDQCKKACKRQRRTLKRFSYPYTIEQTLED
jgi:superfamily II DNA or RNA helicase